MFYATSLAFLVLTVAMGGTLHFLTTSAYYYCTEEKKILNSTIMYIPNTNKRGGRGLAMPCIHGGGIGMQNS